METLDLVKKIKAALEDKKAEDVTVIDIHEISSIADYFVIANGSNANQLTAMQDAVDETMYTNGVQNLSQVSSRCEICSSIVEYLTIGPAISCGKKEMYNAT